MTHIVGDVKRFDVNLNHSLIISKGACFHKARVTPKATGDRRTPRRFAPDSCAQRFGVRQSSGALAQNAANQSHPPFQADSAVAAAAAVPGNRRMKVEPMPSVLSTRTLPL